MSFVWKIHTHFAQGSSRSQDTLQCVRHLVCQARIFTRGTLQRAPRLDLKTFVGIFFKQQPNFILVVIFPDISSRFAIKRINDYICQSERMVYAVKFYLLCILQSPRPFSQSVCRSMKNDTFYTCMANSQGINHPNQMKWGRRE